MKRSDLTRNENAYLVATYPAYPADWKPLTRAQASAMFDRLAVMIPGGSGIPLHVAFASFGYETLQHVQRLQELPSSTETQRRYIDCMPASYYLLQKGFEQVVYMLNDLAISALQSDYLKARYSDIEEMDAAARAEKEAANAKRKAAAEKRRATLEKKKAADPAHQQA